MARRIQDADMLTVQMQRQEIMDVLSALWSEDDLRRKEGVRSMEDGTALAILIFVIGAALVGFAIGLSV